MKTILLPFLLFFCFQIQAQTTNLSLRDRLRGMVEKYGKIAVINSLQLLSVDLMRGNSKAQRDRLQLPTNTNSLWAELNAFIDASNFYVNSEYQPPFTVPGFPSVGFGANDYKRNAVLKKLDKEHEYMRLIAGSLSEHGDRELRMRITEEKRILLLLNGIEIVMKLSLDNEKY